MSTFYSHSHARGRTAARTAGVLLTALFLFTPAGAALAQNAIVTENALPGNPPGEWDILTSDAGDPTIQGFATDISVNKGETVRFKIRTDAAAYAVKIYRLGWYGGLGARHQGDAVITATLPQAQPADLFDPVTGTTDCGNWAESAHWDVPAGAVSGIYIAKLTRTDTNTSSHIAFIVRDDASTSDLLFKTADATWQAYNGYGGNSLYVGGSTGPPALNHASKVSYNRPFTTRSGGGGSGDSEDWLFNAEYPMLRWLERNGYDVTYTTDVDADRYGHLIANHAVFLSVGHDEYWSAQQRAHVTAARDAGTHLAFFSGNEVYWKTRWEPSIDGSATPYRTLVCYKEGTLGENVCGGKCDPLAGTWTGLWRDGCPPAYGANDGCDPENALTGQISWDGTTSAIRVPAAYGSHRFWRNTGIAALGPSQEAVLGPSTLGYEWDFQQYDAFYPNGRMLLSQTDHNGKRHHLSLYRHSGGALVFGAGTVQWSWGLDDTHDRGSDPVVPDMQQATVNLFADMGVQPATLQGGLAAATASSDATPPVTAITFPANGGSVQSGQQTVITGTAADAGGIVALVEVSVDGGSTWQPAAGTDVWSFAWTPGVTGPATIMSRGFDDTGNMETAGPAVNVTVDARVCPCTVFSPAAVPGTIDEPDTSPVELGVRFRTSVDGEITGIRFYKSAANTGTHIGNLWTAAGVNLATVTFTGESAGGWQEATFAAPVAITANTTYIASYHTTAGHYSQDANAFTSAIEAEPLRILADGEDGVNGVYSYSATTTFPTQGHEASNYWVDVVFDDTPGPDVTPPTVLSRAPSPGASGVAAGTSVSVQFNEAIDPATVDGTTFTLVDEQLAPVAAVVTYSAATRTATLTPSAALAYSTTLTATLRGGGADPRIKDLAGNALAADVVWAFTTTTPPPPPPTEGPGGPILLISHAANPFGRYMAEILRTEGFNAFSAKDVSIVTPAVIDSYDVVILGEMPLSAGEVTMLSDWADAGGTLIAMRPDVQLAPLLGLTPAAGTLSEGYLLVNTASGPGVGIVGQTIQFHGTADHYTLNGATAVATLYSNATTATAYPAVTTRDVGGSGGRAIAFTYDLSRSVVYTRQGNPAWAGQERDGVAPLRSDDMFFGNAAGDPQTDWIDLDKVAIPQADEQQRLLANLMLHGNMDVMPLPRFWYLPSGHKAAIVMTGDDHGDAGMAPRFDIYTDESDPGCSVEDWECIRATGYMYIGSAFTPAQAEFYHGLGFEIAMHVNTGCASYTDTQFQAFIDSDLGAFAAKYPALPLQQTNRNHCIAWSGWSVTPEVQAANGIRFDTNYYYWPGSWIQNRSGMFTGSGMPMRFARLDGTIVDCFQATTQMTDESAQTYPSFCDQLLDRAIGAEGYYGVFTTNMHFDNPNHPGSNAIVASAKARGVPVVSAKQMLDWLDGRNGSSFRNMGWNGNVLSFDVEVATGARNLRGMLPTLAAVGSLTGITEDGTPIAYSSETIKGIEYAIFPANAATYEASYAVDATPPLISGVVVTPHTDGTATIAWTTNEASDSRVDYGTDSGSLSLSGTDGALVTSHSVTLSGLAPSTLHYFRVTSVDAASNAATAPEPPAAPLEFTTSAPVCFLDETAAHFAAGAPDADTYVADRSGGEVILEPAARAEFDVLPPAGEWNGYPWTGGGSATVSAGQLVVDAARFNTEPEGTTYGPGTSLEFVATFGTERLHHVGFGGGTDTGTGAMFNQGPIALFSTGSGGSLITRTGISSFTDFPIPGSWVNAPHRYRIDWTVTGFDFWIDGVLVHTEPIAVATPMRPGISDLDLGGQSLAVDWIHVSPYPASGSFTSRVYDAGGPANWDQMSWTADLPAGTGLSMSVRTGNTLVPDGAWSTFTAVPSSGSTIGGNTRYIQYRADLTRTDPTTTPVLYDVHIACTAGADVTPPVISNVVATPGGSGTTATITWDTDEAADSRVDYGTSAGSLTSSETDATLTASHGVALVGLTPGVTYYYRVTSADAASNPATSPEPPAQPLEFTPAAPCPADVALADFQLGTPDAGTSLVLENDGEVILAPVLGTDFEGAGLPAGWGAGPWAGGGSATVAGGVLAVDGARAYTTASYAPLRSIEFVATFTPATFQNVGLAADLDFNSPWVVVGMGSNTSTVYARSSVSSDVSLGAGLVGAPHRYRIDWGATGFDFYVDGTYVTTLTQTIATPMVVVASDLSVGGPALALDWLRVTPYGASGSFTSRVFDMGGPTSWGAATWTADAPAGTGVSLFVRTGDTAVPDGGWTAFNPVSHGGAVGGSSRYLQYRADLSTTAPGWTPALRDVAIACTAGADLTPPAISNVVATPAPDGLSATITWDTDEAADSRVDYGPSGGAPGSNVSNATLVTSHSIVLPGLTPGVSYDYRVTSADASLNSTVEPVPPAVLSFTTPAQACFTDDAEADFAAGATSDTYVSVTADGEVILALASGSEWSGTTVPGDWTSVAWTGGTSTVAGGTVTVDGARLTPLGTIGTGSGVALEFVATFAATPFQHAGFGSGDNTTGSAGMFGSTGVSWAMFSTHNTGTQLYARVNHPGDPGENADLALGAGWLGTPHLYRIEWKAAPDSLIFMIDGASVARRATAIALPMRAGISDYNTGGPAVVVDWIRRSPYAASGTFTSRVHDAGAPAAWDAVTWTASIPSGTGLSLFARTGDTPVPDGSWTAFAAVPFSGSIVGGTSRYVQYRADLTTSDPDATPVLEDLTIACAACVPTPPPAVADLAAARSASGGGAGGRIPVVVTFTAPAEAAVVEVWRAPFGGYPDYDDGGGSAPATPPYPPGAPWTLTGVTASGATDDPPARDAWQYVVFTKSACGVVSAVSNMTAGLPNYLLGDVTDGVTACSGDNAVTTADVSLLGSHYGETITGAEAWACLDVGPTEGGSVNGRPLTDRVLQFEDLVMFALQYGAPGIPAAPAHATRAAAEVDALTLEAPAHVAAGATFDVVLRMSGSGAVQAISVSLEWNATIAEPVAVTAGELLETQGGVLFPPRPGRMDAALLGARRQGISGDGVLAVWTFRALAAGEPAIALGDVDARDAGNRRIELGAPRPRLETPAVTAFERVTPNPFAGTTSLEFSLAAAGDVTLAIYSVDGRRVQTLARGAFAAGRHRIAWNGADAVGRRVGPGLYFARLECGAAVFTRSLVVMR